MRSDSYVLNLESTYLYALDAVECYLPGDPHGRQPRLRHLGTSVHQEAPGDSRRLGETTWATVLNGQRIGFVWEWIELLPGAVCILDPNDIRTNLRPLDHDGCYLERLQAIVRINQIVHRTDWQHAVLEEIEVHARPRKTFRETRHPGLRGRGWSPGAVRRPG